MNKVSLVSIFLLFGLAAGFAAGYFVSEKNLEIARERLELESRMLMLGHGDDHEHELVEAASPYPEVRVKVHREPEDDYALQVLLENFAFAPERAGKEHVDGLGHAHLYVDGQKIARLYSSWYHLGTLVPGEHTIMVRLSTNDHRELTRDGVPIEYVLSVTSEEVGCNPSTTVDHVICYTDDGFSPSMLTVEKGDIVAFVRADDASAMWVASDAHPIHSEYNDTNIQTHCPRTDDTVFDQCENGEELIFMFTQPGMWNFHNHSLSVHQGTINVLP